jgi:hypothetical protein
MTETNPHGYTSSMPTNKKAKNKEKKKENTTLQP